MSGGRTSLYFWGETVLFIIYLPNWKQGDDCEHSVDRQGKEHYKHFPRSVSPELGDTN